PFAAAMNKVALRVHLSLYDDVSSALCHWQIPETHFLEAWGDARGFDGTASIVQPLIAPLYNGKSAHELLAAFTDRPERSGYEIVREYWAGRATGAGRSSGAGAAGRAGGSGVGPGFSPAFESSWRRWLHDGVIPNTAFAPKTVSPNGRATDSGPGPGPAGTGIEIIFRNDPCILDGRFANNGWLQELPKPITKLTWDNAVLVSPK